MSDIAALLQPLKDRLAAARDWDVCDGEQTVRAETGEIIYDRSGYDRSEWVDEFRPVAALIANAPTDQAKLIDAVEIIGTLAEAWRLRGEHLVEFAKTAPGDVAESLNDDGWDMIHNSRLIRSAIIQALGEAK